MFNREISSVFSHAMDIYFHRERRLRSNTGQMTGPHNLPRNDGRRRVLKEPPAAMEQLVIHHAPRVLHSATRCLSLSTMPRVDALSPWEASNYDDKKNGPAGTRTQNRAIMSRLL